MTQKKKAARLVNGTAPDAIFVFGNVTGYVPDWRTNLAAGNGSFRINGTYDHPATGRRLRRIIARQKQKAGVL